MAKANDPLPDAGAVYRGLAPAVLGYLRAQRVADPEDVLGEVFVHVTRDLRRLAGQDELAVRKWVFAIARHRVIDDARRRARRPVIADQPVPDRAGRPADEEFDPTLIDALAGLTPDQRDVVLLRFVADLSLDTVARITHRRVATVKSLQHRGLANLAKAVSESGLRGAVRSVDDNDPLIERLRGLGRQALDPVTTARHLRALPGRRRRSTSWTKAKVGTAFFAGLMLAGGGLVSAGAMPGPAQAVAHTALAKVGVAVPNRPQRYNGPECGANANYRNHGQYVRTHTQDPNAGQSRCGKPIQAGGDTTGTTKPPPATGTSPTTEPAETPGQHGNQGKHAGKSGGPDDNATPDAPDQPDPTDAPAATAPTTPPTTAPKATRIPKSTTSVLPTTTSTTASPAPTTSRGAPTTGTSTTTGKH